MTAIDAFHNYELKPTKDIFPLVFKRVIENFFTPVFHQSLEIQTSKSFMLVAKNSLFDERIRILIIFFLCFTIKNIFFNPNCHSKFQPFSLKIQTLFDPNLTYPLIPILTHLHASNQQTIFNHRQSQVLLTRNRNIRSLQRLCHPQCHLWKANHVPFPQFRHT